MITNKSDSADTSEKFVTPREKKIGDLAQVLERQRQTIKTLLTSKKEENIKRDHNVYMQIQNKPKFQTKVQAKVQTREPEKYQQLCDQILNIGSKLLSGRKPSTLQSYRDANAQVDLRQIPEIRQVPQQKAEGGDKEMDYLKSEEYRLYLQNLTKDEDCNNNTYLLKRMKETRNNNAYTKPSPASKVFKNLEIKSSAREQRSSYRQLRQFREAAIPRKRQILHNVQPIHSGLMVKERSYDRRVNAFDQIIIQPTDNANFKEMLHSPTMKDINIPVSFQNIPKKEEKPSRSVSNNNKIQSRTVDCLVFTGLTPAKSGVKEQSKVQQKKQNYQDRDSPKLCKHSKQWDSDVYKIDFPSLKNKKVESQFGSKELKKSDFKKSVLKQSYCNSNIKKQSYKPESHYVDYKKSKNSYEPYQKNRKCKVVILQQSSHQFTDFGEFSQINVENANLYELNFKLQDPKTKPQYYQSKTPTKTYKEKTPSKVQKTNDKQNVYLPAKITYSYQQESAKTPKKQTTNKKQQQNIIPYFLDCPYNKKWKLQESQATSTVTKSGCDPQPQLRGHSRSKSKLSVVTASKKQKR